MVERGRVVARVVAKEVTLTRVKPTGFLLKLTHLFHYKMVINARLHDSKAYNNNVLPNIRPLMRKKNFEMLLTSTVVSLAFFKGIFKNNTTEGCCCISKLYNNKYVWGTIIFEEEMWWEKNPD